MTSNPSQTYPFPTVLPFTQEQLQQTFSLVTDEADPNPALHYRLAVPMGWGQAGIEQRPLTPQQPFQLRSYFRTLDGPAAMARVMVAYVPEEIIPADWLSIYLEAQRETVVEERHTRLDSGLSPDVLTRSGLDGNEQLSRWAVLKEFAQQGDPPQGSYYFILQVSTATADYTTAMADLFLGIIAHFDLLHRSGWPYAEQLQLLEEDEPLSFSTAYPASWQLAEDPMAGSGLFTQLELTKTLYNVPVGRIYLTMIPQQIEPDKEHIVELFRDIYSTGNIEFEPVEFVDLPAFGGLEQAWFSRVFQTNANPGEPRHWREIVVGQATGTWFYAEHISLTRESSPEAWAVCKRAFEIVLDRLEVGD